MSDNNGNDRSSSNDDRDESPLSRTIGNLFRVVGIGREEATNWRDALKEVITEEEDIAENISPEERRLLFRLIRFSSRTVNDAMVPRPDIVGLDEGSTLDEVVAAVREHGHTRMPVYRGSLDEIVGMVHLRDVIAYWGSDRPFSLKDVLREILFVPSSMPNIQLLSQMRTTRTHMAVVVDEYGGTDGLVTIGDLVEEIVGQIEDEHDEAETPEIVALPDGSIEADARTSLEALAERLEVELLDEEESEDIETIGGLVTDLAGHVPRRGERIAHPSGLVFEVLDADPRRIKRLRIRRGDAGGQGGA
ncbi:MAG: hemolysin family protein [Alphaproteobacteria bacterium]